MAKDGKSWFKIGCFGCLGVLGMIVIIAVIVSIAAWSKVKNEQVAEEVLDHDLPEAAAAEGASESDERAADLSTASPGSVVLDLSNGDFSLRSAPPGSPIHVDAVYDKSSYELTEQFEPGDEKGWSYHLKFRQTRSSLVSTVAFFMGAKRPEVKVLLPTGVPLDLDLQAARGGTVVELADLWLTSARFDLTQGGLELDVQKPLAHPMERLSITGSMGGIEVARLGNASPRFLEVRQNMGGVELDLRGQWVQDSDILVSVKMGGGEIRLPHDVLIKGLAGYGGESSGTPEAKLPTLTFSTSSRMGEIEVSR